MSEEFQTPSEVIPISVSFVQLIREAQQQHGLRHQDFQRYRQYLTRRLGRLRKSLNLLHGEKRRVVVRKLQPDMVREPRHLCLSLFEAERCWAYAMQLKSEANTEPRKRFHMISRLRKAVVYSEELNSLCSAVGDACTKLEANAYTSWMTGSLHFELEAWQDAKENLEKAFKVYGSLAELELLEEGQRELYLQRAEELRPHLRYCAYNIGDTGAVEELRAMRRGAQDDSAVQQLDALLAQTRSATAAGTREVQWLGQTLIVRHERARLFLEELEELEQQLKEAANMVDSKEGHQLQLSVYESLLKEITETIFSVRDDNRAGADNKLQTLHSFLQYVKLCKTVERNTLLLAAQTPKNKKSGRSPEAAARLHDTILQNIQEIAQLPGVLEYPSLAAATRIAAAYHKSQRAYYLALAYGANRKYPECLALLARCRRHGQAAQELMEEEDESVPFALQVKSTVLSDVLADAEGEELSCRAAVLLGGEDERKEVTERDPRPLMERLDVYQEDRAALLSKQPRSLVAFPPEFEPVPAKPLFFDLALNHVQFPSLEAEVAAPGRAPGTSGGITGFVKGWFWGGGKK